MMQQRAITATIIQLVFLGVISGLLTQFFLNETSWNEPLINGTTIWPGLIYGLVVAWAGLRLGKISYLNSLILVIITGASWLLSVEVAKQTMNNPLSEAMSFATAGLVGSAGTAFGMLLVSSLARRMWLSLLPLTIITGTIIASLIPGLDKLLGDPVGWYFFPTWQTMVVLTLAKCLVQEE